MHIRSLAVTATLALAAAMLAQTPEAEAKSRRGHPGPDNGYVTAESRYGPQTITAPVRYGTHGRLEVMLPGGTWIECGRSCRDTLRRETIDFWQSRAGGFGGGPDGPGYLRFSW